MAPDAMDKLASATEKSSAVADIDGSQFYLMCTILPNKFDFTWCPVLNIDALRLIIGHSSVENVDA